MKTVYCWGVEMDDGAVYANSKSRSQQQALQMIPFGKTGTPIRVVVKENKKRTEDASALFHVWCQQLSSFVGEDPDSIKQGLKIKFGYPLLLQDEKHSETLHKIFDALNWACASWEEKKAYAGKYIPCTSIMSVKQLKTMMDNIKVWAINEYNVTLQSNKPEH